MDISEFKNNEVFEFKQKKKNNLVFDNFKVNVKNCIKYPSYYKQ